MLAGDLVTLPRAAAGTGSVFAPEPGAMRADVSDAVLVGQACVMRERYATSGQPILPE